MLENIAFFEALVQELKEKFDSWSMGLDFRTVYTPEELTISYKNMESYDGGNRICRITTLDNVVDITMSYGDKVTYHSVLDAEAKNGYIDCKDGFCCDADCGVIGTVQDHLGINWRNVENKYETLVQQLDRAIEAAKRPTLEEFITGIINNMMNNPQEWEDDDEEDKKD